jgi:hypothetical protein
MHRFVIGSVPSSKGVHGYGLLTRRETVRGERSQISGAVTAQEESLEGVVDGGQRWEGRHKCETFENHE